MKAQFARDLLARLATTQEVVELLIQEQMGATLPREVSVTHLMLLVRLHKMQGPVNCQELEEHCHLGHNVIYNLTRLEEWGYLQKRRKGIGTRSGVEISLTEKGEALVQDALPILDYIEEHVGKKFAPVLSEVTAFSQMIAHPRIIQQKKTG